MTLFFLAATGACALLRNDDATYAGALGHEGSAMIVLPGFSGLMDGEFFIGGLAAMWADFRRFVCHFRFLLGTLPWWRQENLSIQSIFAD
jgi:hypothetical protein